MRNKILIVDDVDINREILRSILEDEYTILEAENGKQALEIVDQEAKKYGCNSVGSGHAGDGWDAGAGRAEPTRGDRKGSGSGYQWRSYGGGTEEVL